MSRPSPWIAVIIQTILFLLLSVISPTLGMYAAISFAIIWIIFVDDLSELDSGRKT